MSAIKKANLSFIKPWTQEVMKSNELNKHEVLYILSVEMFYKKDGWLWSVNHSSASPANYVFLLDQISVIL